MGKAAGRERKDRTSVPGIARQTERAPARRRQKRDSHTSKRMTTFRLHVPPACGSFPFMTRHQREQKARAKIRAAMRQKGLSNTKLGAKCGVSGETIRRMVSEAPSGRRGTSFLTALEIEKHLAPFVKAEDVPMSDAERQALARVRAAARETNGG